MKLGTKNLKEKVKAQALTVSTVAVGFAVNVLPAFAADGDIFSKGEQMASALRLSILGISTTVAVCSIAFALMMSFFSHNQKSIDASRSVAKGIAATWLVLNLLSSIATYASSWVGSSSTLK